MLGTGMGGFGAAYALQAAGVPFVCFDKNPYYGGHTRSFRYGSGFVFDEGGHISFTKHEHVKRILAENVRGSYEERLLRIDNYWHGLRIAHPVQSNLYRLPVDLIVKIITDFWEADREIPAKNIAPPGCSLDARQATGRGQQTYADWLYTAYGKTFAETFPIVYGQKYHTTTMDRLTVDWIGPRMYRPSLSELVRGAFEPPKSGAGTHYVESFRYPSVGGFVSYLEPFAKAFDLRLGHRLVGLDYREKLLSFENGALEKYSAVISSIPLPDLIPLIRGVPREVLEAARKLAFTTAVLCNIGIDRADLSETAITYFYDEDIVFSRVNLPHLFSPNNAPHGCGTIQAEVYFSDKYKPLNVEPESLMDVVVRDLRRCDIIRESDTILMRDVAINRFANVIYDSDRNAALAVVHGFLDDVKVLYCGRYGNWDHAWTDQAFMTGEASAVRALDQFS